MTISFTQQTRHLQSVAPRVIAATALTLISALAHSASVDLLLMLQSDGNAYTVQQTISTDKGPAQITLGTGIEDVETIYTAPELAHKNTQAPKKARAGTAAGRSARRHNRSATTRHAIVLNSGTLIIRYQHTLGKSLTTLDDQSQQFMLSAVAANVVFSGEAQASYSARVMLPPTLEFVHRAAATGTNTSSQSIRTLSIRAAAKQGFSIPIHYRQVDSDRDGVADLLDRCPASPASALVDRSGCEPDADSDGVTDIIDLCASTAPGAIVNDKGCEPDVDNDGLPDRFDQCDSTPANFPISEDGCALDSDNDGVVDGEDDCPGSEAQEPVSRSGCSLDFDNDGVPNYRDLCRSTAYGRSVNNQGCEPDSDADGVVDRLDVCPASPASITVDRSGCATDLDSDSVPDYRDICLTDLSSSGAVVATDNNPLGCTAESGNSVLSGVTFNTNSAFLSASARAELDRVARAIVYLQPAVFEIGAHTDNVGGSNHNNSLSQARADTVRQYLMVRGVSPNLVTAKGYGESAPIRSNDTQSGRQHNRRVELRLLPR